MFRIRIDFGRQFVELLTFLKFKVVLPVVLGRSIHAMRFDSNMIGHYLRVLKGRLNRFWISFSMRQLVYDGVRTVYDGITTIPGPTACMPVVQREITLLLCTMGQEIRPVYTAGRLWCLQISSWFPNAITGCPGLYFSKHIYVAFSYARPRTFPNVSGLWRVVFEIESMCVCTCKRKNVHPHGCYKQIPCVEVLRILCCPVDVS